jgi:hypothetical protein
MGGHDSFEMTGEEMKQKRIAGTIADATLPKTPIEIGGKTYNLCFTLGALSEAETSINAEFARQGSEERVNLLQALPSANLASTIIVFAAAVRTFHPEITFDEARELLTFDDLLAVFLKVRDAWNQSRVKPKDEAEENPTVPAAEAAVA